MLIAAMPMPTIRSGHADIVAAVTSPATTMATLAKASLRAERKAALVRLPTSWRYRARIHAQARLTASAPRPVSDSSVGSGGSGTVNFCQAAHTVAIPGTRSSSASTMPRRARRDAGQPRASAISVLTEASSRKSTLSANSETEPIASATPNSIAK